MAVLSVFSAAAFAQTTVRGQLVDSETGEPLVGTAVMVEGTSQGTVTDIDGYFKQSVAQDGTGCSDAGGRYDYFVGGCGS